MVHGSIVQQATMPSSSSARDFTDCITFLAHLLEHEILPAIIVLCCSREDLLAELQVPKPVEVRDGGEGGLPGSRFTSTNTIRSLALASSATVAYAPSLAHARAYLATLKWPAITSRPEASAGEQKKGTLAIWGLIEMHKSTDEHTAQGIFRSLSLATDAAYRANLDLIVAERAYPAEWYQEENEPPPISCWEQPIPLLSQSIKFEGARSQLSSQSITVGDVVRKRCNLSVEACETVPT